MALPLGKLTILVGAGQFNLFDFQFLINLLNY
jgi:hypothetical protein